MPRAAIETRYAGHLFRSRLEARWAALFDLVGWQWIYEPFDGAGYVPDFLLEGDYPVLVEVKPASSIDELKPHIEKIEAGLRDWTGDVLIVGITPDMQSAHRQSANPVIGLLGEGFEGERAWDEGEWRLCGICPLPAFSHTVQSYTARPCGHYAGGHTGRPPSNLKEMWGMAHEATRWSP